MTYKAKEKKKQAPVNQLWMTNPRRSSKHQKTSYGYQRVEFMSTNSTTHATYKAKEEKNQAPENQKMPGDQQSSKPSKPDITRSFKEGLDDVINVNALFTSAVFIGLSFSSSTPTLETREECKPGVGIAKWLVIFEIIAFGFFLVSSLLGKALKIQLHIIKPNSPFVQYTCRAMMVLCAACSILGSVFLFLAMINVLQMRLGKLTCKGNVWIGAGSLIILYFLALLFWVPSLVYVQIISWDIEF
ncbi:hypothetical protein AAG906_021689 [Vitis piasezkii]